MTTLKNEVKLSGQGIHSGMPVNIIIKPSDKKGIFFRRVDIPGADLIAARFDNVGDTKMRNTTIGNPCGAHVQTVEHLMAAFFIVGIDSAIVEIDGPETPILDGSASIFYEKLSAAVGARTPMRRIIVRREVSVSARDVFRTLPIGLRIKIWFMNLVSGRKSNGYVKLKPNDGKSLNITATLVYPEKIIGSQTYDYSFDGSKKSVQKFIDDIARARTFGKYSEWEYLKAHGMGRGANETNVIALNDAGDGTLNKTIWHDEFVRHKIIDALGDMFTSGGFVVGDMISYKGSHAMNNMVLKKLFSDSRNYDIVE